MKRQIANVNTHIFRHPFIPWGQRSYPLSLQPDLLLDAIDLDYLTLVGTDVSILGDQSGNGYDFTQTTAANRPVVDSALVPTQIDFTSGNAEFLENTLDISTFAAMSQGSIVGIYEDSSALQYWFAAANSTVSNEYFIAGVNLSKAQLWVSASALGLTQISSPDTLNDGDVVEWSSNGSEYLLKINGLSVTPSIDSGLNNGNWINLPVSLDNISIARLGRSVPVYRTQAFKHLMIRSTPLSVAESLEYATYLNETH